MSLILDHCEGFDWDEGNSNKNWFGHRVTDLECEEMFINTPLIVAINTKHSSDEKRYEALGRTTSDRRLFVAFKIRQSLIRIISAREMNRREWNRYEKEIERNS
ncbi:MAG: BrnT family toxin [Pyrinomonadaceae bacterium]